MNIERSDKTSHVISDRCMRCYGEQQWYGKNFLLSYLGEKSLNGKKILEIGCAEAGLLKFFTSEGATCYGVELSDIRFRNAILLNKPFFHVVHSWPLLSLKAGFLITLKSFIIFRFCLP